MLEARGVHIPHRHVCNSAGIIDFPNYAFDMVRSGIITYGMFPSPDTAARGLEFSPVLEWKAHVVSIQKLPKGWSISYGRTFTVEKENMRVATVSVGYGDGYPRALSNRGRVLIHGKFYPIIGLVCMDQFMVDISDSAENEIQVEDLVTLVGREGGNVITFDELAELSGTIHYELICNINGRVPRIYLGSNAV